MKRGQLGLIAGAFVLLIGMWRYFANSRQIQGRLFFSEVEDGHMKAYQCTMEGVKNVICEEAYVVPHLLDGQAIMLAKEVVSDNRISWTLYDSIGNTVWESGRMPLEEYDIFRQVIGYDGDGLYVIFSSTEYRQQFKLVYVGAEKWNTMFICAEVNDAIENTQFCVSETGKLAYVSVMDSLPNGEYSTRVMLCNDVTVDEISKGQHVAWMDSNTLLWEENGSVRLLNLDNGSSVILEDAWGREICVDYISPFERLYVCGKYIAYPQCRIRKLLFGDFYVDSLETRWYMVVDVENGWRRRISADGHLKGSNVAFITNAR